MIPKLQTKTNQKYTCLECGLVEGVMYWSTMENEFIVDCEKCGGFLQVYQTEMYHTGITEEA